VISLNNTAFAKREQGGGETTVCPF